MKKLNQARKRDDWPIWAAAILEEIASLNKNDAWKPKNPPSGAYFIPTKFVLKFERTSDGSISKYYARLVVLGNNQRREYIYF